MKTGDTEIIAEELLGKTEKKFPDVFVRLLSPSAWKLALHELFTC